MKIERLYDEIDRESIDSTFANMFSSQAYRTDYVFYAHIGAQCKIIMTDEVPIAGVNFEVNRYNLFINPDAFGELSLEHRMGVIKHEMLHILLNHITRVQERDHETFNLASDCALNQSINREHLPEGSIYPDTLQESVGVYMPSLLSAEQYYELIPSEFKEEPKEGNPGDKGDELKKPHDNHSKWGESSGESDLQQDLTKRMLDKAVEKSRGSTPSELSKFFDIWNKKAKVQWKKVLRNIVSNQKANKKTTIMRKSRRFPGRADIRGTVKDRTFDLVTVIDTSGSVSDDEIVQGLVEINEICKLSKTSMRVLQVDTECSDIEEYNPKKKTFNRKHSGGTYIAAGVKYLYDNKIQSDALVVISDMEIEDITTDHWWLKYRKPVIFLSTRGVIPAVNFNHKIFNLEDA